MIAFFLYIINVAKIEQGKEEEPLCILDCSGLCQVEEKKQKVTSPTFPPLIMVEDLEIIHGGSKFSYQFYQKTLGRSRSY